MSDELEELLHAQAPRPVVVDDPSARAMTAMWNGARVATGHRRRSRLLGWGAATIVGLVGLGGGTVALASPHLFEPVQAVVTAAPATPDVTLPWDGSDAEQDGAVEQLARACTVSLSATADQAHPLNSRDAASLDEARSFLKTLTAEQLLSSDTYRETLGAGGQSEARSGDHLDRALQRVQIRAALGAAATKMVGDHLIALHLNSSAVGISGSDTCGDEE